MIGAADFVMVETIGFAAALAMWFLIAALPGAPVSFDRETVMRIGPMFAVVIFALTGPIMALEDRRGRRTPERRLISWFFAVLWALALGMVIVGLAMKT